MAAGDSSSSRGWATSCDQASPLKEHARHARALVLATGLSDMLPYLLGLEELLGSTPDDPLVKQPCRARIVHPLDASTRLGVHEVSLGYVRAPVLGTLVR